MRQCRTVRGFSKPRSDVPIRPPEAADRVEAPSALGPIGDDERLPPGGLDPDRGARDLVVPEVVGRPLLPVPAGAVDDSLGQLHGVLRANIEQTPGVAIEGSLRCSIEAKLQA